MSAPLRFLGLVIVGYVGLRAAASALALTPLEEVPLPAPATPLLDALVSTTDQIGTSIATSGYASASVVPRGPSAPQMVPLYLPHPAVSAYLPQTRMSRPMVYAMAPAEPMVIRTMEYAPPVARTEWPVTAPGGPPSLSKEQVTPSWSGRRLNPARENRWQLSSWALLRQPDPNLGVVAGSTPLASTGMLGGSQAGARLTYQATNRLSAALRVSSPLDPQLQQGRQSLSGEGALGISWQPWRTIPVRLMAERRQRFGPAGGRNAFALLAEGGVYGQPLGWGLTLDGYGQAGMVGLASRDLFAEGGATVTRPLLNRFALGGGVWGGLQPGISRLDAGPRLSYRWTPRIRVHLDYRWKLIGNASPPSGPAVTIAGDF